MCLVCDPPVEIKGDDAYLAHMAQHQGVPKPNIVKQNVPQGGPVVLSKDAPPSSEFLQMAQAIDQKVPLPLSGSREDNKLNPPPDKPNQAPGYGAKQEEVKKPLKLVYEWKGQHSCGTNVITIVVENHAIAWCINCQEQVKTMEIHPIINEKDREKVFTQAEEALMKEPSLAYEKILIKEKVPIKRKKVKKHARNRPGDTVVSNKTPVQTTMQHPGVSSSNRPSI
jgi:hypothetical protein